MPTTDTKAAIFQPRRIQLLTIQQALNKYAEQICAPEVAANVRGMITGKNKGKAVKLSLVIMEDNQHEGKFCCQLKTYLGRTLGTETFSNLD